MTASEPDIVVRPVTPADQAAIAALQLRVFGPGRFVRTAYRIREGTPFSSRWCRAAWAGERLVAAIRMTPVSIGGEGGALLLGPLAVDPDFANRGFGRRLIREATEAARADGMRIILLVGNMSYYGRLGYVPVEPLGRIRLPGPVDPARILAHELVPNALAGYAGLVVAA